MDEDPFFRRDMVNDLEREGYEIATAENGRKAVELIHENRFDLVITGLGEGPVDGIDVLKYAKENYPEIMVIIFTAQGNMSSAIKALQHDADD